MDQEYRQELRTDSTQIIYPLTAILVVFGSVALALSYGFTEGLHFVAYATLGPLGIYFAWQLTKKGKQEWGAWLFTIVNLLLVSIVFSVEHSRGVVGVYPYIYALFIVISSMILPPATGFTTWFLSIVFMIIGFSLTGTLNFLSFTEFFPPILINFLIALVAFISAIEWQIAVESTSYLHLRVQQRRDELFSMQEELRLTNARLQFMNQQLDTARQEAVNERDMRTRFMNNVSHELRTPLNSIVNFAHILSLGGRGPVTEDQKDYLARIEKSGWHLLDVLNDLLDMAQIESGEFKLHLEPVHLYHICEEAMSTTRGLLMGKTVELLREYPDEWPIIRIDQIRFKQALLNLLGNAAKYTEEGYIKLSVKLNGNGDTVLIAIEDTGIGIPLEFHQAIFIEFRQVDKSAARKRIGTGLGLPITKHLVERHGGSILVDSELGKGSTFTIAMPVYALETGETAVALQLDSV